MPCQLCDDTGWKPVEENGVRRVVRCDCWRAQVGRNRLAEANIPKKYQHCTLDNFNAYIPLLTRARETVRAHVDSFPNAPRYAGAKPGLFLHGLPGTGKSHLVAAALTEIIHVTNASGVFYDTRELLRLIRSSYNPTIQATEFEILRPVMNSDLLVLDDLGAEKTSDWVSETLNMIVNTRYSACRPTFFTSNYQDGPDETDPNTLLCRIGFRMRSRLSEMCEFIELDGADYRHLPPNFTDQDLISQSKLRSRTLPSPRGGNQARAHLREPAVRDGKADLKWPGGRAGS